MSDTIQKDSKALIHYTIKLKDGSTADSTEGEDKPVLIFMGRGDFSDRFEESLIGKKAGDKVKIPLLPEDAFGDRYEENLHEVPMDNFQEVVPSVGEVIVFEQPNGDELPGIVKAVAKDSVTIDFNHPLAGQEVVFHVEVVEVNPDVESDEDHDHDHDHPVH